MVIFFYFLTLAQVSWPLPNLVLAAVLLINILEPSRGKIGLIAAISGAFFLDVFSGKFFGFWIITLVGVAIALKYLLKKYVNFELNAKIFGKN